MYRQGYNRETSGGEFTVSVPLQVALWKTGGREAFHYVAEMSGTPSRARGAVRRGRITSASSSLHSAPR